MNSKYTLEFDKILEMLSEYALTDKAKAKIAELSPFLKESEVKLSCEETTEARLILDIVGNPPLTTMKNTEKYLETASKGGMLEPKELTEFQQFLSSCRRLKAFLKKAEATGTKMAYYGNAIDSLELLYDEIERCIRNEMVDSSASNTLRDIRRKKENTNNQIKVKLDTILKGKKEYFSDSFVSNRNGHFTLPVKKEYKNQISGSVIDISATGATYFIEPSTISKYRDELSTLEISEMCEVEKILYSLTSCIDDFKTEIKLNIEAIETLDFIFAKGKLSSEMKAVPAKINTQCYIKIAAGKHPLLKQSECVPLDFELGNGIKGIIITGPNTGGKTVALKTVGLFTMMSQCGLHIPCKEADLCMTGSILCDIGDGQSISENLSTFSSHIRNIIKILEKTNDESLVLLDELGSGTDPAEGMGIAVSILEELKNRRCLFVATTHYPEVKEYAEKAKGLINARMTFDRETLAPMYQLKIGEAGESCALYIAKRLGFPKNMLKRAYDEAYSEHNVSGTIAVNADFIDDYSDDETEKRVSLDRIIRQTEQKKTIQSHAEKFSLGDSVIVYPEKKLGIICQAANTKGELGVMIQKRKSLINHKRIKLKTAASELYPPDYDFSVIFDSVETRKARHKLDKGHHPDIVVQVEDELK
jgi:dsDNA-specific endonuclease/ATPase MutS2